MLQFANWIAIAAARAITTVLGPIMPKYTRKPQTPCAFYMRRYVPDLY